MRAIALLVAFLASCFAGTSAQQAPSAQSKSSELVLTIRARLNPVKTGSELVLEIDARNISDHDVNYSGDFTSAANYVFYITHESGTPAPEKESLAGVKGIGRGMGSFVFRTLKPGEVAIESVIISDYYDFGRPGKYKIQVLREREPGGKGVKSNTITVTVVP